MDRALVPFRPLNQQAFTLTGVKPTAFKLFVTQSKSPNQRVLTKEPLIKELLTKEHTIKEHSAHRL